MVILKRNRFLNPKQIVSAFDDEAYSGGNGRQMGLRRENFPSVNIFEEAGNWGFTFEVPGVDPHDLKLTVRNNLMTVQGKRSSFFEGDESRIHCRESCMGECEFKRSVHLPWGADPKTIHAHVMHGMLFVTIEKAENKEEESIEIDIEQKS